MRKQDRHLQARGQRWHYVRRVPTKYADIDNRVTIRVSLSTDSLETARKRRDEMEVADDLYWSSLLSGETDAAEKRYRAAVRRALALSITYAPAALLARDEPVSALLDRIDAAAQTGAPHRAQVEAVLGGVSRPKSTVRQALKLYLGPITRDEVKHKSPLQLRQWTKVKQRAVSKFCKVVGDKSIEDITRADALKFHQWFLDQVVPTDGRKPISGSTANRDFGNMRKLYAEYFAYIGDEDRQNPFRGLSFDDSQQREIPPFPTDWIKTKLLAVGAFGTLNTEAKLIAYALIETGARPSEIANLDPSAIRLNANVPHISIEPTRNRQIKTGSSKRVVPLVGVSLAAMCDAPRGFPRYKDSEHGLSAVLMRAFSSNGLFPTPDHRVYSLRHSFEKRMAEAGLDYGLRCLLMGHATDRPAYGDGGSLEYRRDELLKIALPYPDELICFPR